MSSKTTTAQLVKKMPQYIEEVTEGTTPTSPTFTSWGATESISLNIDGQFVDIDQLQEDLISIIQGLQKYEFKLKYYALKAASGTTPSKYAVNAANYTTPAGTISSSLTFLWSVYLNGTENFIVANGCRAKDFSVNLEVGKPTEFNVTFECTNIVTPSSSGPSGATYAANPTGAVLGWLDGGATPVSWNASGINCKKISVSINRNTNPDYILGQAGPFSTQPHGRRISGDFQTLWTATTLETDFKTPTSRTLVITLDSTNSHSLTLSSTNIISYKRDKSGGDTTAIVEDTTMRCLTAALT